MSLSKRRVDLAVLVANRSCTGEDDSGLEDRIAAFKLAYAALAELDGGSDDWTAVTLDAAWDVVAGAFPAGADVERLVSGLVRTHEVIVATAAPPKAALRRKRRRDA